MEERKQKEIEHANKLKILLKNSPDEEKAAGNKKFYSIARQSRKYVENRLKRKINSKNKFLDYCCGDGAMSIWLANEGAEVYGIDISDVSIQIAKENAAIDCQKRKPRFWVMDAENLKFGNNNFEAVFCGGVLHHLNIDAAYQELARVLKPGGMVVCAEPLAYNPVFQLYRKMTPKLRTEWEAEHILNKRSIYSAKKYFGKVEVKFFHLAALLAVPFRHTRIFNFILAICEGIDGLVLKLPAIKWLAWQAVFVLSDPKK